MLKAIEKTIKLAMLVLALSVPAYYVGDLLLAQERPLPSEQDASVQALADSSDSVRADAGDSARTAAGDSAQVALAWAKAYADSAAGDSATAWAATLRGEMRDSAAAEIADSVITDTAAIGGLNVLDNATVGDTLKAGYGTAGQIGLLSGYMLADGNLGLILDANNDQTSRWFRVFNNSTSTQIFELDESGNVIMTGNVNMVGGDLYYYGSSGEVFDVASGTPDGSDSLALRLNGGGSNSRTRGAYVSIVGNEFTTASARGDLQLYAGDVGEIELYDATGDKAIAVEDDSTALLAPKIMALGNLYVDAGLMDNAGASGTVGQVPKADGTGGWAWGVDEVDTAGTGGRLDIAEAGIDTNQAALDSVRAGTLGGGSSIYAVTIGPPGSGATFTAVAGGNGDSVFQAALDSVSYLPAGLRVIGLFSDSLVLNDTVYITAAQSQIVGTGKNRIYVVGAITGILDTTGYDRWGLSGLRFMGDGSAYAAFGGINGTDSVTIKDVELNGFTGASSAGIASDSLSQYWQFENITLIGNTAVRFNGIHSLWRGVTIREPGDVGLAINWHRSSLSGLAATASGGDTTLLLFAKATQTDPSPNATYSSNGIISDCNISFSDSNASDIGIYVDVNYDGGSRSSYGGSINNVRISNLAYADKGYGVFIANTRMVAITGGNISGFLHGFDFDAASYNCVVSGIVISFGDTGVYSGHGNAVSGCRISHCTTNGINILAGANDFSYGNLHMSNNSTNVTDAGTGTNAGDTNGIF